MIIAEEVLDHLALVTEAKDEFLEPVRGINLHDMPENGAIADGHHGFGPILGFLPQPGALASAQDDDFHNAGLKQIKSGQDNQRNGRCKRHLCVICTAL